MLSFCNSANNPVSTSVSEVEEDFQMAKGYVPVVCTQGKIIGAMMATSFLFFAAFPIST
jgi:hypothetical protein